MEPYQLLGPRTGRPNSARMGSSQGTGETRAQFAAARWRDPGVTCSVAGFGGDVKEGASGREVHGIFLYQKRGRIRQAAWIKNGVSSYYLPGLAFNPATLHSPSHGGMSMIDPKVFGRIPVIIFVSALRIQSHHKYPPRQPLSSSVRQRFPSRSPAGKTIIHSFFHLREVDAVAGSRKMPNASGSRAQFAASPIERPRPSRAETPLAFPGVRTAIGYPYIPALDRSEPFAFLFHSHNFPIVDAGSLRSSRSAFPFRPSSSHRSTE